VWRSSQGFKYRYVEPPVDWKYHCGQLATAWLHTVESDIKPFNFGYTAWCKVLGRKGWH